MKKLLLLCLLVSGLAYPTDCNEIWKQCSAFCQQDSDPLDCYDDCMSFYGCRK